MLDISKLTEVPMKTARRDGTKGRKFYDGETLVGKECSMCREPKASSDFNTVYINSSSDGLSSRCIDCTKKEQAKFRDLYREDPAKDRNGYGKNNSARTEAQIKEAMGESHPDGLKTCPTCGVTKTVTKFHKNRSTKDGLKHQCAKCANRARKVKGDPKDVQARKYPNGTKVCPKCKETKSLSKFYKNRSTHDGLHRNCRSCDSTHYRNKRREEYESHWRSHGIPFECYICQGPYEHSDHVIPTKLGGSDEPTNRLPICAYHNGSKNGTLLEDWLASKHHDIMADVLDKVMNVYNVEIIPSRK